MIYIEQTEHDKLLIRVCELNHLYWIDKMRPVWGELNKGFLKKAFLRSFGYSKMKI